MYNSNRRRAAENRTHVTQTEHVKFKTNMCNSNITRVIQTEHM